MVGVVVEDNKKFNEGNERKVLRLCSWANFYKGKKYDVRNNKYDGHGGGGCHVLSVYVQMKLLELLRVDRCMCR